MLSDNSSKVTSCFLVDSERLASKWAAPQLPNRSDPQRPLANVLRDLLNSLRGDIAKNTELSSLIPDIPLPQPPRKQDESSMMEESIIDLTVDSDTSENPKSEGPSARAPGEDPLWAIADVMLAKVEQLLSNAVKERSHPIQFSASLETVGPNELFVRRVMEDEVRRSPAGR